MQVSHLSNRNHRHLMPEQHWPLQSVGPGPASPRHPRFAKASYPELLAKTTLSPRQQDIVRQFVQMTKTPSPGNLPLYLKLLSNTHYKPLAHTVGRHLFHTPMTDLFSNLPDLRTKTGLLHGLVQTLTHPENAHARENSAEALSDLYFYVLAPGGQLEKQPAYQGRWGTLKLNYLRFVFQRRLDPLFRSQKKHTPPESLSALQKALRIGLFFSRHGRWGAPKTDPKTLQKMSDFIQPYLNILLPASFSRTLPPTELITQLEAALLNPDPRPLRTMSENGTLEAVIPEWAKATGPDNAQHAFHDFPLDEHTLRVVERTKTSPYYQTLGPHEKKLVTIAALLHDIGKHTGPLNLKPTLTIDHAHPIKSAEAAREIMPSLGYSARDIERVAQLIEYHQLFGSMIIQHPDDKIPSEERIADSAARIRNPSLLAMLKALSEGDIRGVKENDAIFSDTVKEKLEVFSKRVEQTLAYQQAAGVFIPQTSVSRILQEGFRKHHTVTSYPTLSDALAEFNRNGIMAAFSTEGNIPILRLSKDASYRWVTASLDVFDATIPSASENGIHRFRYMHTETSPNSNADGSTSQSGVIVDLLPENTALAHREINAVDLPTLQKNPKAFYQFLTDTTDEAALGPLLTLRKEEGKGRDAMARFFGFNDWFEVYKKLIHHDHLPEFPQPLAAMAEALAQHHGTQEALLGIRPLPQAVYIRAGNGALQLPEATRRFIQRHRLPLIICP